MRVDDRPLQRTSRGWGDSTAKTLQYGQYCPATAKSAQQNLNPLGCCRVDRGMAAPLVCDEFWALIAALVPPERREADGPPIPSRASPTGMLFVLKSGIPSRGAAGRDGLRLKDELSAPFAGVAARGCLAAPASRPARSPGPCQRHNSVC